MTVKDFCKESRVDYRQLIPESQLNKLMEDFARSKCKEQREACVDKINGMHTWYESDKTQDKVIEKIAPKIKETPLVI